MGCGGTESACVAAIGINHVSIVARDLDESTRFYEEVFGMERVPSPDFPGAVRWLRVGNVQLHLLLDRDAPPRRAHFGLTIDDFDAAYEAVRARADDTFGWDLVELPSGSTCSAPFGRASPPPTRPHGGVFVRSTADVT